MRKIFRPINRALLVGTFFIIAGLLAVYAAMLPVILGVLGVESGSAINPSDVMSLVSVVLAILSLAGGVVFLLLRDQIRSEVRSEFTDFIDLQTTHHLGFLLIGSFQEILYEADDGKQVFSDPMFRSLVIAARRQNEQLFGRTFFNENLPRQLNYLKQTAINNLIYAQATEFQTLRQTGKQDEEFSPSKRDSVLELIPQLIAFADDDLAIRETIIWAKLICYEPDSEEWKRAYRSITTLFENGPEETAGVYRQYYARLFESLGEPLPFANDGAEERIHNGDPNVDSEPKTIT